MLRNVPLMGQYDAGDGVHLEAQTAWGIDAAQALRGSIEGSSGIDEGVWVDYEEGPYTIRRSSGGMPLDHAYTKSMFTEGAKWYCPDTGKLYLATSTADSNRRSGMPNGLPYLSMQVWVSEAHQHCREGGKGMDNTPRMNSCYLMGTVADLFKSIAWNEVSYIAFWYNF